MRATRLEPTSLAKAIVSWVEFESLCGRDNLVSEGYLSYPIASFLNANLSLRERILPEEPHPVLNFSFCTGRPRQMDFALRDPDTGELTDALETNGRGTCVPRSRRSSTTSPAWS